MAAFPPCRALPLLRSAAGNRRSGAKKITLFFSLGFAIEDFAALRYIHAKLAETGFFTRFAMIADPDDPRGLFGTLLPAGGANLFGAPATSLQGSSPPQCIRHSPTTLRHSPGAISFRWVKRTEWSGPSIFSCQNSMKRKSCG